MTRPGAAVVVLAELEQNRRWPAGDSADDWATLNEFAAATLRRIEKRRVSATLVAEVASWASRRKSCLSKLARSVSVEVNTFANDRGLFDHDAGRPNVDFEAALKLSRCDPRIELDQTLERLSHELRGQRDAVAHLEKLRAVLS